MGVLSWLSSKKKTKKNICIYIAKIFLCIQFLLINPKHLIRECEIHFRNLSTISVWYYEQIVLKQRTHLMQFSGSLLQSMLHLNLSQSIQPTVQMK